MDEKWKKFLIGSLITLIGVAAAYFSSLSDPTQVVWKTLGWLIVQKLIATIAALPIGTSAVMINKQSGIRKFLSRM